jgi:hypothetical protein
MLLIRIDKLSFISNQAKLLQNEEGYLGIR